MNTLFSAVTLICCVSVGVSMLSLFIPQNRTRKILSFVLGLFILVAIGNGIKNLSVDLPIINLQTEVLQTAEYDAEYEKAILRDTADRLVLSLNAILNEEGIIPEDIRLSLKKSADNSISVDRVIIYISDAYRDRIDEIGRIVYGNLSKEPEVDVTTENR